MLRGTAQLFTNRHNYFKFVLGDQQSIGLKKYVMRGFIKVEMKALNLGPRLAKTFNKMHAGYKVRVQWGTQG